MKIYDKFIDWAVETPARIFIVIPFILFVIFLIAPFIVGKFINGW
jgi:hypothetical protein